MIAVALQTLEQRILLAADLPVQENLFDHNETGHTAVDQFPVLEQSTTDPADSFAQVSEPLSVVFSSGQSVEPHALLANDGSLNLTSSTRLTGSSDLNAHLVNQGVVAPGSSPGILNVSSFTQQNSGTLEIEIGGSRAGALVNDPLNGYDQLAVANTASLAGALSLNFINDFVPTAGQVFDVLKWGSRTGAFASYQGLYAGKGIFLKPVYLPDRLQLVAVAIPGLSQLSLAGQEAQTLLDTAITSAVNSVSQTAVSFNASLDLGGLSVGGDWQLAVAQTNQGAEFQWSVANGTAAWSVAGIDGGLVNVSGNYRFTLSTDPVSNVVSIGNVVLDLSGTGKLAIAGAEPISAAFTASYVQASNTLQVRANDIAVRLGDASRGASVALREGAFALDVRQGAYSLSVAGAGSVSGFAGAAFAGNLRLLADSQTNRLRFVADNATFTLSGLGTITGNLTFDSRTQITQEAHTQEFLVSAQSLDAQITLGDLLLNASDGVLGLSLSSTTPASGLGLAQTAVALFGKLDLSVQIDTAVNLIGRSVQVYYNPSAAGLQRELTLANGQRLWMELAAGQQLVSGNFSAEIDGVISFEGDLVLELNRTTRLLSNGQNVELLEYALYGSKVGIAIAAGGSMSQGLAARDAEFALIFAKDRNTGSTFLTSRGALTSATVAGYVLENLESAQWSVNRALNLAAALPAGVTVDWSQTRQFLLANGRQFVFDQVGEVLTVPVQGSLLLGDNRLSGRLAISYDRSNAWWDITAQDVQWWLAAGPAFVRINQGSGSLRIDSERKRSGSISGAFEIGGVAGLSMAAQGIVNFSSLTNSYSVSATGSLNLAGFGALTGSFVIERQNDIAGSRLLIGASNVSGYVGAPGARVAISNASLGLILSQDARGNAGYALSARGAALLEGFDGISLSAAQATISINRMGQAVSQSIATQTGAVALEFADERDSQFVSISGGSVAIAGVGTIAGDLRIESKQHGSGATARQQLEIGFDNLSATGLALGGAGISLAQGRGALLLFKETVNQVEQTRYAVVAEGNASLTGLAGITLSAQRMQLSINRTGLAVDTAIATASGWVAMNQRLNESRLRGYGSVSVGNVIGLEGQIFIESLQAQPVALTKFDLDAKGNFKFAEGAPNQPLKLSSTATADMLVIGGYGLSAGLYAPGADIALSEVSLAMVLATETGTTDPPRRWLTASAMVGDAEVGGVAKADVEYGMVELNLALDAQGNTINANPFVIDWGGNNKKAIEVSDTDGLILDIDSIRFVTGINGELEIGGAKISGTFFVSDYPVSGGREWAITAADASVSLTANGASATIQDITGTLYIFRSGTGDAAVTAVRGNLAGTGSVTGVDGLTATGLLQASFDNQRIALAGSLNVAIAGVGSLAGDFAIVKEPVALSAPVSEAMLSTLGASGSTQELTAGGQTQNTVIRLNLSDASGKVTREGLYSLSLQGQTQTFSSLEGEGLNARPVTDIVLATRIQQALERFASVGIGNVVVSGTRASGFAIEFVGTLAGKPIELAQSANAPGLWMVQPADRADKEDWGLIEETSAVAPGRNEIQTLQLTSDGAAGQSLTLSLGGLATAVIPVYSTSNAVNERQVITLSAANRASGQFWFTVNGKTTAKVRYSADPTFHAAEIQSALQAVLGSNTVTVTYRSEYTGNNSIDYLIDFRGSLAGKDIGQIQTHSSASDIRLAAATIRNGSPGFSVLRQAQAIQEALESALGAGSVAVSYDATSTLASARYAIEFKGDYGSRNLNTLVASSTGSAGLGLVVGTAREGSQAKGAVQTIRLYDEGVIGTFE